MARVDYVEVSSLIQRVERLLDRPIDSSEAEDLLRDVLSVLEAVKQEKWTAFVQGRTRSDGE